MKNQINSMALFALCIGAVILLNGFTSASNLKTFDESCIDEQNGVEVTVVKDRGWLLIACGTSVLAQSSTEVFLDDTRVMITNIWRLPEGHCLIPEKGEGAAIYENLVVTPNGMAKGQAIVHPREL